MNVEIGIAVAVRAASSMNGTHEVWRVCVCWGRSSPEVLMMNIRAKGIPASRYAHASFTAGNNSRRLIKQHQTPYTPPPKKKTRVVKSNYDFKT